MSVAILMCTYNGERYLVEQLNSFVSQTYENWHLYVNDDGSSDRTLDILEKFGKEHPGKLTVYKSVQKKSARNFFDLACKVPENHDFYGFSDQDDIWLPHKIERSVHELSLYDQDQPLLYGSRTQLIDANGNDIGFSPLFGRPPSFRNALVQSIAGGNTMLFNVHALRALKKIGIIDVVSHDWIFYQVVTGVGGVMHYDSLPSLLYRQHGENLIGCNTTIFAKIKRLFLLFQGRFQEWNQLNYNALRVLENDFTQMHKIVFLKFHRMRTGSFFERLRFVFQNDFYRQSFLQNACLKLAIFFKKM